MNLFKRARLPKVLSFIVIVLVVILLIFLIKNSWDMGAAAQDILALFGSGKK